MRGPRREKGIVCFSDGSIAWTVVCAGLLVTGCQQTRVDLLDGKQGTPGIAAGGSLDASRPSAGTDSAAVAAGEKTAAASDAPPSGVPVTQADIQRDLNLGHREVAMNHPDQAEIYYRRVLQREPTNTVANHRLAVLADQRHDFATAERLYLAALKQDAKNPDLLSDLGYSYFLQRRYQESEHSLLTATHIDPWHHKALCNLGVLYAAMGDYERSLAVLRRALGEREARATIARLFPNGAPGENPGGMVASFEPAANHGSSSPSQSASFGLSPGAPSSEPPVPSVSEPERSAAARATVPDDQINDAFSAIDREGVPETHAPSTQPTDASSASPTVALSGWAQPAAAPTHGGAQAAPEANPLDSMSLWPPNPPGFTAPVGPASATSPQAAHSTTSAISQPADEFDGSDDAPLPEWPH